MARKPQLSFATMNLQNFNIPGQGMYRDLDGLSNDEYTAKAVWIGRTVAELNADIIGFQELWHADAIHEAFKGGLDRLYEVRAPDTTGKIANAIAVRHPHELASVEWISDFPARFRLATEGEPAVGAGALESAAGSLYAMEVTAREFSRPVLHATVRMQQGASQPVVHVFVAHLKSRLATPVGRDVGTPDELSSADSRALGSALSSARRAAEAAALRLILNDTMDGKTPVIVVGDLK